MFSNQNSSTTTNALSLESHVVNNHQVFVDLEDVEIIRLVSSLSRACLERYSEERNKIVAEAVLKKARIMDLFTPLYGNNHEAKFEEIVDINFLELAKKSTNPMVALAIISSLENMAKLPLMMHPHLIGNIRKYRADFSKILLRHGGLFGYLYSLFGMVENLSNLLTVDGACDNLLQVLCCIKVIYDLHRKEQTKIIMRLLNKYNATHMHQELAESKPLGSQIVFGNLSPKMADIQEMMVLIFSIDESQGLLLNEAYFNLIVSYIQNHVTFHHMQNQHKSGSLHGYQLKMWDASIKQLRESEILSEKDEKEVRSKLFVWG